MTALALIFTLSAIGISETMYLIRKRVALEQPLCPIGKDCAVVLSSRYSKIFLIPNDLLGLFAYIILSIISAFLVVEVGPQGFWKVFLIIMIIAMSLVSFFFTYLQWRVIRAWCFWCLMSASTIWLMLVILLVSKNI
ncbi:hypothetical protein A3A95_03560 [Candidatus Nomurabacteria bacterium RIFCSPLOWO2_01_FULL_39_18]|uniref:Vitamin K epoxide reductase domain-containing protein n=1 Tax=Candidatus Nomurabacteria bacterium RIFCSPHIGHO2_01_FULL_40_24b TaxID=1801739 RepID=A0A1F6V6Q2_9BACT|nr:MAG: hypothetical protein A2647_04960 [Candidatus Nomurabacteria bacterium RIFCSPHIGHO2_01_FULL_40_24b]OGI89186.1 MAG: hypothetical protein A3A95_03560 [Candidatus Nomurabacteria bacterium RIFCSPLOWO2_01_FULL_39_18]